MDCRSWANVIASVSKTFLGLHLDRSESQPSHKICFLHKSSVLVALKHDTEAFTMSQTDLIDCTVQGLTAFLSKSGYVLDIQLNEVFDYFFNELFAEPLILQDFSNLIDVEDCIFQNSISAPSYSWGLI